MNVHFPNIRSGLLAVVIVGIFGWLPDASAQFGSSQEYGIGAGQQVGAHQWGTFFMIGLIVGMIGGIILTFYCLARREKQAITENQEFEALMEALAEAQDDLDPERANPFSSNPRQRPRPESEYTEPVDPWERPSDWWKGNEEER